MATSIAGWLEGKAIEAAQKIRFQPATNKDGEAISVRANLEFSFVLD